MSVRTIEELYDHLSSDISWRKKELSLLKGMITSSTSRSMEDALLRSGIALLYAHWEGFVKLSASTYLEYIRRRRLPYEQLSNNFIAIRLSRIINRLPPRKKVSECMDIVEFFQNRLGERFSVVDNNCINTESNLSSKVFREIISTLNFDYSPYATKEVIIDEKLVANRNKIAHGRYLQMDSDEYFQLESDILALMNLFNNQIDNAVVQKSYLRA
jgi:hypothetical protein